MTKEIKKEYIKDFNVSELIPYAKNPRINDKAVDGVIKSIKRNNNIDPVEIDENNIILTGHTRKLAFEKMKIKTTDVLRVTGLTESQKKSYRVEHNKTNETADWDFDMLREEFEMEELEDMDFDIDMSGDDPEIEEDEAPELKEKSPVKLGDIWTLGNHRLMCGDSTDAGTVALLMNGEKADMVFTDPPYGMKKEKDGVLNDNLNYDDLLEFNKKWIPLTFNEMKDNGSWYCWGTDEPLMDIYSQIIKPMIKNQKATFRNLITWDKGNGQGQNSDNTRSYAIADEKCLFVMCGVQGFNNNSDNYFDGWDSVVNYLDEEKTKAKLTIKDCKRLAGHSESSGCHWFDKSQWSIPTKEVYDSWRNYCKQNNIEAFKKEYDILKKEYDILKKEYYSTRAYFNNTHDNFNNVWHFDRIGNAEKEGTGGHATPKPIVLCSRVIKSSSKEGEKVLDVFGGSFSTMIACHQLNRTFYGMELDPKYCDVGIRRWQNLTKQEAIREDGKTYNEIITMV